MNSLLEGHQHPQDKAAAPTVTPPSTPAPDAADTGAIGIVEPARAGMASGINTTFRQVGTATGVAVLGALFARHLHVASPAQLHGGVVTGLNEILLVGAITAFVAVVATLALVRECDFVDPAEHQQLARPPQPVPSAA